jgi:hypothetical protein
MINPTQHQRFKHQNSTGFQNRQKPVDKPIKNRFCYRNQFRFLSKADRFSKPNQTGFVENHKNRTGFVGF